MSSGNNQKYSALKDYAMIGDCHGSALISNEGSIDWCCLRRMDAEPFFSRILDADHGGYFKISPVKAYISKQSYLRDTNVLKTEFFTDDSSLEIIDFMPVGRSRQAQAADYVNLSAPFWLIRRVKPVKGKSEVLVEYKPTGGMELEDVPLSRKTEAITSPYGPFLYSNNLDSFNIEKGTARNKILLSEGDELTFAITNTPALNVDPILSAEALQETTEAFWREWTEICHYDGRYSELVTRSALVLKMLTYAPTGAIVAAPTTSLPEEIGGERNFDYRFSWIRDASFTLYALASIGYSGEAKKFASFVESCFHLSYPDLQIVYGIGGETDLIEKEHLNFEGYKGSQPVRTGNKAYEQSQLDIYGELQEGFEVFLALGGQLDESKEKLVSEIADAALSKWRQKDHGIWEMRSKEMHHVYSKVLCWVAIDRASKMLGHKSKKYEEAAQDILAEIKEKGINPKDNTLRQAYENDIADASLLRCLLVGIPLGEEVFQATVKKIEDRLSINGFLYRYEDDCEDGFSGDEGAFMTCSFWLVSALLQIGEYDRGREKFDWLIKHGNAVKMFSEEIDPHTCDFLGNYPQALTHLALIESAVNLRIFEKRGVSGLRGAMAERVVNSAGVNLGILSLLGQGISSSRRIFSSNRSKFIRQLTPLKR